MKIVGIITDVRFQEANDFTLYDPSSAILQHRYRKLMQRAKSLLTKKTPFAVKK